MTIMMMTIIITMTIMMMMMMIMMMMMMMAMMMMMMNYELGIQSKANILESGLFVAPGTPYMPKISKMCKCGFFLVPTSAK